MSVSTQPPPGDVDVTQFAPVVPDYALERRIGKGGFGEVWVARNSHSRERRALKILSAQAQQIELDSIRVYQSSIQNHEYLVPILHVGKVGGLFYYVMPLADDARGAGWGSVDEYQPMTLELFRLSQPPLSIDTALIVARHLLNALGHLQSHGCVHRDVKPQNILRMGGAWKLGDIGIMMERTKLDQTAPRGTLWFLPPEGARDYTADLYALGKTLFLLVTGAKVPKNDSEPDKFSDFLAGNYGLPGNDPRKEEFRQVILKACAHDPNGRFPNAGEMLQAVTGIVRTTRVMLKIDLDFDKLSPDDLTRLLRALAEKGISATIIEVRRGSVLVTLELPISQVEALSQAVKSGVLVDPAVKDVWLVASLKAAEVREPEKERSSARPKPKLNEASHPEEPKTIRFLVGDVVHPRPMQVLTELFHHLSLEGEVVAATTSDSETSYLVVRVTGLADPIIVPVKGGVEAHDPGDVVSITLAHE
jgi:serine/threonine protein kinase